MFNYKNPKEGLPLVPLNEDERYHLETIYGARLRRFCLVYIVFFVWIFMGIFFTSGKKMKDLYHRGRDGRPHKYDAYDYEIFGHALTGTENYWLTHAPLILLLSISGGILFYKRIYTYKKDLKLGQKEKVTYTIINKSYFPMTNQYFFSFDNPDYMHYEVDEALYYSLDVGYDVSIYRAKYSKHVFEKDARFTLM